MRESAAALGAWVVEDGDGVWDAVGRHVGAGERDLKLISLSPENADARKSLAALRKRMGDRPKRSSSGWRMPSMPSMQPMPALRSAAWAASVVSMGSNAVRSHVANGQLVVKCVLGVFVYYVLRFLARILGFGDAGAADSGTASVTATSMEADFR